MIKVGFIISGFDYSGAEMVLDKYIENNLEIDPYFIILYRTKVEEQYLNKYGKERVITLGLKHNKNILRFLPMYEGKKIKGKLIEVIEKNKFDIIYANNTQEVMLCGPTVKEINCKSIGHIHDMKESIKSPMKVKMIYKYINNYDRVITVSEATKKSWEINNILVIYNGITEDFYAENLKESNQIKTLGFIGKICKRKGVDILREAYESQKDKELNIAYGSVEEDCNCILKQFENMKNVKMYYKISGEQIKTFYDNLDLLIVPSREDPLPTVILEAMARGILVIGANTGGVFELLGEKKLIFEANNIEALKEKLKEIDSMSKEERIGYRIRLNNRCKEKFSQKNKVASVNEIIKNLI